MTHYTRHQLKEDKFTETAAESLSWMREHGAKVRAVLIIAVIAIIAAAAGWFYMQQREQQASLELSKALRTYSTPLREANTPPNPEFETFTSAKERADASRKQFRQVADNFKHTRSGEVASYLEAVAAMSAGDAAAAEPHLKELAGSRNKDLSSLAKIKLAALYRGSNRDDQAIAIYKDLMDHPTRMVTKSMAQLELASAYESKSPAEAQRIYQSMVADNPASPAAQIAQDRMKSRQ